MHAHEHQPAHCGDTRSVIVSTDIDWTEYHVIDGVNEDLGPVQYVWPGSDGTPEFVGVRAGMLGRTHLIPFREATMDLDRKLIRVPYHYDTIKNTRHISPGTELTVQDVWELYNDYNLEPPEPGAPSQYHADLRRGRSTDADEDLDTPANPV
jgi:hypothetical protein